MRESRLHRTSLAIIFTALCLAAVAGIACGPQDEPQGPNSSGPDYLPYQDLADQASNTLDAGEYPEALELFQEALATIKQTPGAEPLKVATAHDDVARTLLLVAETQEDPSPTYAEALHHYQEALEIRVGEWGQDDLKVASSLDRLATVYLEMGDYDQAVAYYQQALDIRTPVLHPDHAAILSSWESLADAYLRHGNKHMQEEDYPAAVSHYQQALELKGKATSPQSLAVAPILDKLTEAHSRMEEYEQAVSFGQLALDIRKGPLPAKHDDVVTSRNNLALLQGKKADAHFSRGEYGPAQRHYEEAGKTLQASPRPDPKLLSSALINLSVLHDHLGNYARSLLLLQDALGILTHALGDKHPDTVAPRRHLADAYFKLGNYQKAQELLQEVLSISGDDPDLGPMTQATFLSDLGAAHLRNEEFEKALPRFQEALTLARETQGEDSPMTVPFMNNLAVMHRNMGNTEEALRLYQDALKIRRDQLSPEDPALATSLNNLGALYFSLGDYTQALPLFQEALEIREQVLGPAHPDTAISLNNLGVLHASQGDHLQALEHFLESIEAQDTAFNNLFAIASEEQKLLFVKTIQSTYQLALSLIYRHFKDDPAMARQGMELVLGRKGIVLDSQSQAQAVLLDNLDDPELAASWDRLQRLRGDLAHLLLSGPARKNFSDYRQKIEGLKREIAQEESVLSRALDESAPRLFQQQATPAMVAANLPPDGAHVEFVRVQEWVEKDRNWSGAGRYLAFVLTPDRRVDLVDLGDAAQLDAQIAATRTLIEDLPSFQDLDIEALKAHTDNTDAALLDLYQRLVPPLGLSLDSIQRLSLSPDGELNKVPFAALRAPDGRYLVETHTISYVTSGRDLLPRDGRPEPEADLLLAADLDYSSGIQGGATGSTTRENLPQQDLRRWNFPRLPGTAQEARLISPLVPGQEKVVISGAEGTESAIISRRSSRVVHLATHGFFLPDRALVFNDPTSIVSVIEGDQSRGVGGVKELPLTPGNNDLEEGGLSSMVRSGLALSGANQSSQGSAGNDGILTALEVTGMDLRGTELVVLSACQTAEGAVKNGEGVFGLRRAFALAGARNVMMSQWLVSDQLTVDQMVWFYQEAFDQNGSGRVTSPLQSGSATGELPEALRQAQLNSIDLLRETSQENIGVPLAPVKLWAPFIIQVSGGQALKPGA